MRQTKITYEDLKNYRRQWHGLEIAGIRGPSGARTLLFSLLAMCLLSCGKLVPWLIGRPDLDFFPFMLPSLVLAAALPIEWHRGRKSGYRRWGQELADSLKIYEPVDRIAHRAILSVIDEDGGISALYFDRWMEDEMSAIKAASVCEYEEKKSVFKRAEMEAGDAVGHR